MTIHIYEFFLIIQNVYYPYKNTTHYMTKHINCKTLCCPSSRHNTCSKSGQHIFSDQTLLFFNIFVDIQQFN